MLNLLSFFRLVAVCYLLLIFASDLSAEPKIKSIRAMLFYQNTGKFSEDVFTTPSDLWNVSFDYVYSTFVVVETESEPDFNSRHRLEFFAVYQPLEGKQKIIVRKTAALWFDEKGRSFSGFWLDNVGCDPVKLSANIKGQKKIMRKTINFGCGE